MLESAIADVYSADEVARAAGVPVSAVRALVDAGGLRPLGSSPFFAATDVVRNVRRLRIAALSDTTRPPASLFATEIGASTPLPRRPLVVSACAHLAVVVAATWLSSKAPHGIAAAAAPESPVGLVFLMAPGPGGGGGGSGSQAERPAGRLQRVGHDAVAVPPLEKAAPAPAEEPGLAPAPEPVVAATDTQPEPPPVAATAPVVSTASGSSQQAGSFDAAPGAPGTGPGNGGQAGAGLGHGSGQGTGSGLGAGDGGGIGGGPYRPGTGIQPPRLLREVKADYSEEARRRNVTGDVLLEIVVQRDGRVGQVTVLRGLGAGLDERAVAAVRQWQFAAARRQNQAVDVIVEVAVEFSLR